jgi:hypothetical protein
MFGPDCSVIVHTFPDDWTIRHLETPGDEYIEATLLHHCLGSDWWFEDRSEGEDCFYSLRDVDNHPHATFRHFSAYADDPAGWTGTLVGHGDAKPVKLEYARRIAEWHASLPYPVELDRTNGGWPDELLAEDASSSRSLGPVGLWDLENLVAQPHDIDSARRLAGRRVELGRRQLLASELWREQVTTPLPGLISVNVRQVRRLQQLERIATARSARTDRESVPSVSVGQGAGP